jgi:hypothetical protein
MIKKFSRKTLKALLSSAFGVFLDLGLSAKRYKLLMDLLKFN